MTTAPAPAVDARQLANESLASAPFPGRSESLRVYFDKAVHNAILKHAGEDTTIEICGVLVGVWKRDELGPYAHVSASIRGDAAASKFAEVTFTHETWSRINERMDKEFADKVIVGWYHTHPDFGVFLSDRDVFIHQHFFSAPGQVALVIDPVRHEEGVFTWQGGKPVLTPAHWVGDGQRWAPGKDDHQRAPVLASADTAAKPAQQAQAAPQPASITSMLTLVAAAAGLFAAGYFFSGYGERQQQQLVAQELAQQLYNRTNAPQTRQSLQEIRALLSEIGDETRKLTEPKKEGAEPADPKKVAAAIMARIGAAADNTDRALAAQTLRPEQQAAIDVILENRLRELIARGVIQVTRPGETPSTDPTGSAKPTDKPADKPATSGAAPAAPAQPADKGGK